MTTGFADLYDLLRITIPALTGFTTKTELGDAYDVGANTLGSLINGWAVRIGDSGRGEAEYSGNIASLQRFSVILTREVVATDGDPVPMVTAIKAIKDDILTLQRSFLMNDNMGLQSTVEMIDYESTDRIQTGRADDYRWIHTAVNFNAAIRESLT